VTPEQKARRILEDAGLEVAEGTITIGPNYWPTAEEKDALDMLKIIYHYEVVQNKARYL
jgi:hypothetical protein